MENDACSYRRFLDGEEAAFEEIQEEYFDRLVFFIHRYVRDVGTAEDVAIDVLAELAVKKKYNFSTSLSTYLFTLARSRALTAMKKQRRQIYVEMPESIADQASLEAELLKKEELQRLSQALAQLPPEQRTVIHLVYFENFSYDSAAHVMKKTKKQVDNLLFRAKNALKILIEKNG